MLDEIAALHFKIGKNALKDELEEVRYGDTKHLICVADQFVEEHRWHNTFQLVFRIKESPNFYAFIHEVGATEMQETEFDVSLEGVYKVEPKTITSTVYWKVSEDA